MLLRVDPASSVPLFEQLAAAIRADAANGAVVPGERLPAARDVAASLDINVHTVLRAYQILRDEGLVDLRPGRGAVITDRARDYADLTVQLSKLVAEAKRRGLSSAALTALIREEYSS